MHETTGAVYDTLAQIHLMRGSYEKADEYLRMASEAYGAYGTQTARWYEWSLKVLGVKLAIQTSGATTKRCKMADELVGAAGIPPSESIQADLAGCEALLLSGRIDEAEHRLDACEDRLDPRKTPANWGEFLRIRGTLREQRQRHSAASHDFAQSANVFDLLGERYQAALSQLGLGRLAAKGGARSTAQRYLDLASAVFTMLGAQRDLDEVIAARDVLSRTAVAPDAGICPPTPTKPRCGAWWRRPSSRSCLPAKRQPRCSRAPKPMPRSSSWRRRAASSGCWRRRAATPRLARDIARGRFSRRAANTAAAPILTEPLGKDHDGGRFCTIKLARRITEATKHRFRMFASVARQGFELCGARERPPQTADSPGERSLEPLLPGFICASAR